MNVNSQLPVLTISDWLNAACNQLKATENTSALLDAEIILAHTLKKSRTFLHAHSRDILSPRILKTANTRLMQRLNHVPIAYIVGNKEFYGRRFLVTSATLIPRPESESIIDILKSLISKTASKELVDVGTGSGCLGITAKLEFPNLEVTLLDISHRALNIATKNAEQLNANVKILKSNLLQGYNVQADIIVANLPYVDPSWHCSPDTRHEPALALFADNGGKALIYKLIDQSVSSLKPRGILILEADTRQHKQIITYANEKGLRLIMTQGYCLALQRS